MVFDVLSLHLNLEWNNTREIFSDAVNIRTQDTEWLKININRMLPTRLSFGYDEVLIYDYIEFLVARHEFKNIFERLKQFRTPIIMKTYLSRIQFLKLILSRIFYSPLFCNLYLFNYMNIFVFFFTLPTFLWNGDMISNNFLKKY